MINDQLDTDTRYLEHRQLMRPPLAGSGGSSRPKVWIHLSGANRPGSNKRASASSALPAKASARRSHGSGGTEPQFRPQRTGRGGAGQPVGGCLSQKTLDSIVGFGLGEKLGVHVDHLPWFGVAEDRSTGSASTSAVISSPGGNDARSFDAVCTNRLPGAGRSTALRALRRRDVAPRPMSSPDGVRLGGVTVTRLRPRC